MKLRLTILALSLATVLPAASAAEAAYFVSGAEHTRVTSTSDGFSTNSHHVIDLAKASITCLGAFQGTQSGKVASSLKLEAEYSFCKWIGQTANFQMRACAFFIYSDGRLMIVDKAAITCSKEPIEISIPSPPCKVTIGPQTIEGAMGYKNLPFSSEVTMEIHASGLSYTATGWGCLQTGLQNNGNYTTGNTLLTGEDFSGWMTKYQWE